MHIIPQPRNISFRRGTVEHNCEVRTKINKELPLEGYRLTLSGDGCLIEGGSDAGLFYGGVTLKMIKREYYGSLPCVVIEDSPVYSYRGFMLDPCRHFFTADEVKRIIDIMADLKFNRFHFHLSDDQGFRVEMSKHKRLNDIASSRKGSHFGKDENDDREYRHIYTKDELRDINEYCKERFIEVIPEIDVPGHTSAILSAYPELSCEGKDIEAKTMQGIFTDIMCAGNENTIPFIEDIIDEITEIFDGGYFHIGGDEAPKDKWEKCDKCKEKMRSLGLKDMEQLHCHMVNELALYLEKKGKNVICWNEANKGGLLGKSVILATWMDPCGVGAAHANNGGRIIAENFDPYYLDYPYYMHPLKDIYKFDPLKIKGLENAGRKNVIGIESPMWTEYITTLDRLTYLGYPRWFAVADTAWRGNGRKNYHKFLIDAEVCCERLNRDGINTAPRGDWDPDLKTRLKGTAEFLKNMLSREAIKNFIEQKKERLKNKKKD